MSVKSSNSINAGKAIIDINLLGVGKKHWL